MAEKYAALLLESIKSEDLVRAKDLLESGADPNHLLREDATPFHLAVGTDSDHALDFVRLMLCHSADPNVRSSEGLTPLHVSAIWGKQEVLHLLLANGADPFLMDEDGDDALDLARQNGDPVCIAHLKQAQEEVKSSQQEDGENDYTLELRNLTVLDRRFFPSLSQSAFVSAANAGDETLPDTSWSMYRDSSASYHVPWRDISASHPDPSRDISALHHAPCRDTSASHNGPCRDTRASHNGPCRAPSASHHAPCRDTSASHNGPCRDTSASHHDPCRDSRATYDLLRDASATYGPRHEASATYDHLQDTSTSHHDPCRDTSWSMYQDASAIYPDARRKSLRSWDQATHYIDATSPDHVVLHQRAPAGSPVLSDVTASFHTAHDSLGSGDLGNSDLGNSDLCSGNLGSGDLGSGDLVANMRELNLSDTRPGGGAIAPTVRGETSPGKAVGRVIGGAPWQAFETAGETPTRPEADSDSIAHRNMRQAWTNEGGTGYEAKRSVLRGGDEAAATGGGGGEENWWSSRFLPGGLPTAFTDSMMTDDLSSTSGSRGGVAAEDEVVSEYLYTDAGEGVSLVERRCPAAAACGGRDASSQRDDSTFAASGTQSEGEAETTTAATSCDWRDYETATDCDVDEETHAGAPALRSARPPDAPLATTTSVLNGAPSRRDDRVMGPPASASVLSDASRLSDVLSEISRVSVPSCLQQLSDSRLHAALREQHDDPGPVTASTRCVYLRRLARLYRRPSLPRRGHTDQYCSEVQKAISGKFPMASFAERERLMCQAFSQADPNRKWREGNLKSSFNYLLLDPRVTDNLPLRCAAMSDAECSAAFFAAVFYVGKGKRSRPYSHFYEALRPTATAKKKKTLGRKLQHIRDIWSEGLGVVSLHCFQNVIPVEAYTREACMIEALGLGHLTNQKKGDFYSIASTWSIGEKRQMGAYLLLRARNIFLSEGERQIRPADI
ncbi:PREDICTED: uncharacterized protein LOC106811446 [Priapulus caudatus]|uniref:Uncharacterized protein LOC106811446 n=1 Tax=Priapulus caudatus TaxID=37621 RepID=A0ABM1EEC9_PRICU|nr:PREDICTED: uncharacterized protein LOC106811446 [Priapulus caudatus]